MPKQFVRDVGGLVGFVRRRRILLVVWGYLSRKPI
jgi:hypothetical protein